MGVDGQDIVPISERLMGGYAPNDNLLTATDSVVGTWNYSYDNLNRLIGATAPVSQPTGVSAYFAGVQTGWGYDAFGNRLSETQGAVSGAHPTASMPTSSNTSYTATNQVNTTSLNGGAPLTYDAGGDVTVDGLNSYLYDAEGRICAVKNSSNALTGYLYNAEGIRVAKGSLTSFSCNFSTNGFAVTSSYVLGAGGEQVTEYAVSGATSTWQHTNAFASGALLASYHDTDTYFALEDWLGTKRAEVTPDGLFSTFRSLPYGNGLTQTGNATDATEHHFTGKERDSETGFANGNDYFEARYYSSSTGRFMSPDWSAKEEPVPYAKLDNPQTLNLYSYVENNPLSHVDADGHDALRIVDQKTGHVTILIPVHMTGRGATKARVHEILQCDNNLKTGDPNTSIKVIYTKTPVNGVMNTLDISPRQDTKMCGGAGECVNALGGNKGHIDSRNSGDNDAGPHEDLHFAGLTDKYQEKVDANGQRFTPPSPGYDETNIMSARPGTTLKPEQLQETDKNQTTKHCTASNGSTTCQ